MLETEPGAEQDAGKKGHEWPDSIRNDANDVEALWRPA
jgi:hypothetical protein